MVKRDGLVKQGGLVKRDRLVNRDGQYRERERRVVHVAREEVDGLAQLLHREHHPHVVHHLCEG